MTVEDQEIKLKENKEELNQLKETLEAKENEIRARQVENEKTHRIWTGTHWMDKEQRLPSVPGQLREQERKGRRPDGRDEVLKRQGS